MNEEEKEVIKNLEEECLDFIEEHGNPEKRNNRGCCNICYEDDLDKANEIRKNMNCRYAGFMKVFLPKDTGLNKIIYACVCDYQKYGRK